MSATTLLQRLLHPEDLGHAVSDQVRALVHNEVERWSWRPLRVYLAGPMSGLPTEAYWEHHMRRDLAALVTCGRVATLPGWQSSRGAQLEVRVANALHMTVRTVDEWIEDATQVMTWRGGEGVVA